MYSSTSIGSDVIMTSNCICDIIYFFIRTIENTNELSEKMISFRRFSDLRFKETRL